MQRRTLLLFALFVVTAWFYASFVERSGEAVIQRQQKQIQMLNQADQMLSGTEHPEADLDQG